MNERITLSLKKQDVFALFDRGEEVPTCPFNKRRRGKREGKRVLSARTFYVYFSHVGKEEEAEGSFIRWNGVSRSGKSAEYCK